MNHRRRILIALPLLAAGSMLPAARAEAPAERWSTAARQAARPTIKLLIEHPFISAVSDGTLSDDAFFWFISQQLVRLEHTEGTIRVLQRRMMSPRHKAACEGWISETQTALAWTKDLLQMSAEHRSDLDPGPQQPAAGTFPRLAFSGPFDDFRASPALRSVLKFERDAANREHLAVAVAAVASGFWVAEQMGRWLADHGDADSGVCGLWLKGLSDPSGQKRVEAIFALADELAMAANARINADMTQEFLHGCDAERAILTAAMTA